MSRTPRKPELMSPAGYWPEMRAAVEAGADAVFFGMKHFTARAKVGFEVPELPDVMRFLHERGVRGFLTFNTLVFDREIHMAAKAIEDIARAGVDAIIVQDLGIARLAREIAPELEVHGSTQMSITSKEGAELAYRFGANRVVLGRELSLRDIERIASSTDIELEVFVHGALCVSYSGQCFSSEAWGGRSANRGQCAQACRLPYDLIVDGQYRNLEEARYLLSPGDLYALHQVPELMRIGVDCFKIEGRYKGPEYVAITTQAYRKAIDETWEMGSFHITPEEERDIEQVYSRGLGPWFMQGTNHRQVVRGRAPRHRGVKLGEVTEVGRGFVRVKCAFEPKPGEGLVFDAAHRRSPELKEEGGNIYEVSPVKKGVYELRFGNGQIDFSRIAAGDWVWRSSDPTLQKKLKPLTEASKPVYTRPVNFEVYARAGEPMTLVAMDTEGHSVVAVSEGPVQLAQNRALTSESLQAQLGKLGGTPFHLADFHADLQEGLFMPLGELNTLRRQAVDDLLALRGELPQRNVKAAIHLGGFQSHSAGQNAPAEPQLHLLVRTPEQLEAAIEMQPASITLDYLELYGLKPSVQNVKEAGIRVRVASPRILKPTEQNIQKFLLSLDCEILVRSGGLLEGLLQVENRPALIGDFSLNTANVLTADTYLELGVDVVTPTHDLNALQIEELAENIGGDRIEVIAYQHLPVFHTEHCVFCRFLSEGTDYTNCGHPCESHKVALKDKRGLMHPVMADVGCRNTVFGAEAQSATKHLTGWLESGIQNFRLEFVHESAAEVRQVTLAYQSFLSGQMGVMELESRLQELTSQGITEGSLFVPHDFENLTQLM
ncbi:U32 family peptidase [Deinococcus cellulosilyticus]|uniref:Protease n=1 Tax=Deinococcus cellulosilyticus (strain DSM 18568 / NBRC 106333 / KACC 11606 / 5516J-15) TaxID=1223518 RepID=A0A511NAW1_DEIC1|nr:U32 family peptidase [Deinococcus cellulosilyticus]GEM49686.1 protease [Deinococcus cellulosilyticus NBRC 106333 = KACC 11606]